MILKNVRSCFVGLKRRQPYRQNGGSTRRGYRPLTLAFFILVVVVTFSSPRVKRTEENNRNKKSFREALDLSPIPTNIVTANHPLIVGHRGALYDEMENTLPSFQRCIDLGCDAVELDVYLLMDGSLIVFHGEGTQESPGDLSNYCIGMNGRSILDLDYQQTQALIFNDQFAEFGCDSEIIKKGRIPTLKEVLTLLKDKPMIIKIELKGAGTVQPTLRLVEEMEMVDQCHFSSFDLDRLQEIRTLHPEQLVDGTFRYKTGVLYNIVPDNFLEIAEEVGASEIHLRYDACTVDRIKAIHSRNMKTMAWFRGPIKMKSDIETKWTDVGNEDVNMYLAVAASGVQQLCLNRPSVAINLWHNQINT